MTLSVLIWLSLRKARLGVVQADGRPILRGRGVGLDRGAVDRRGHRLDVIRRSLGIWANAPVQEIARPSPIATAACARRAGAAEILGFREKTASKINAGRRSSVSSLDLWRIWRNGMPARKTASIKDEREEKDKICVVVFSPRGTQVVSCVQHAMPDCWTQLRLIVWMRFADCVRARWSRRRSRSAAARWYCSASRASAFWKANDFSILHPVRDRQTVPASRRRIWLARFRIPARSRAAGCDRAAYRKRRQHDHFDLGRHQRALLGHLVVDLKDAADGEEILAGIRGVNLRDAQIDRVGIGRGRSWRRPKTFLDRPWRRRSRRFWLMYSARQPADGDSSCSGTLSLPTRPHFGRAPCSIVHIRQGRLGSSSFSSRSAPTPDC